MLPQGPCQSLAGRGRWNRVPSCHQTQGRRQAGHGGIVSPAAFPPGVRREGRCTSPPRGGLATAPVRMKEGTPARPGPGAAPGAGGAAAASRGARALPRCGFCSRPGEGGGGGRPSPPGEASPPRHPRGAAAARRRDRPPPGRRAAHRSEQKAWPRPGNVPGRRAEPRRQPGGRTRSPPRPGAGPAVPLSPPLTAASGPAAGEPGEKDAMQQLWRRGGRRGWGAAQ